MDDSPQKFRFKKKVIKRKVEANFESETWGMVKSFFNKAYAEAVKGLNRDDLVLIIKHTKGLCEACGVCCHRSGKVITITDKDILRIHSAGINIYNYFHFVEGQWRFKHTKVCVFLKGGKCSIYPYRPTVCRVYPITELNGQLTACFHKSCKIPENLMVHKITTQLLSCLMETKKR